MTVHMTIEMDEAVKARLDALSASTGETPAALLVEAAGLIAAEHDALMLAIDAGLASLDAGNGIPHEKVVAEVRRRRAERTKAA